MAGFLLLSGTQSGLPEGSYQISETVPMGSIDTITSVTASGANTVAVPTGAAGCIVTMPSDNTTVTATLQGVSGDTGLALALAGLAAVLVFSASAPANIVITLSAALTAGTFCDVKFF
jgi:hypothetical protein